jgi:hypothetical protein
MTAPSPSLFARLRQRLALTSASQLTGTADAPMGFPPGHFYSPVPSISAVLAREGQLFAHPETLPGINLNAAGQRSMLQAIAPWCAQHPFDHTGADAPRFVHPNDNYALGEAVLYFGLVHALRPARVIEVGSGYSTMALLDALDGAGLPDTLVTCVEPYPALVQSLQRPTDASRLRILPHEVQDVPLDEFAALQAGDILFIDSTHVSKIGSDVHSLYFEVLPRLAPGVVVHVHDVYFPFEYPRLWLMQGRGWNEVYLLRAFLQFNPAFEIICWNSWLAHAHPDLLTPIPHALAQPGSGLWLRRV